MSMKFFIASLNKDGKVVLTASTQEVELRGTRELSRNVWELAHGKLAVLARSSIQASRLAAPHLGVKKS